MHAGRHGGSHMHNRACRRIPTQAITHSCMYACDQPCRHSQTEPSRTWHVITAHDRAGSGSALRTTIHAVRQMQASSVTHIQLHSVTYKETHRLTHRPIQIHTHTSSSIDLQGQTQPHMHMYRCLQRPIQRHLQMQMHMQMHIGMHTPMHIHINVQTCPSAHLQSFTSTCAQACQPSC